MAAIPLDIPVEVLHAEAMMDPGDIADLSEFINGFQPDIPQDELSVAHLTHGLTTLNHSRKGKIGMRPSDPWSPTSLFVFLNNLPGKRVCPNGARLDVRIGKYICYTFQRAGLRGRQRFRLRISKRWDEIHVRIARTWLPQQTQCPQTPEEVEWQALRSQPWRALQDWIMSRLHTRERPLKKARRKLGMQYCGIFKMQRSSTSILEGQFGFIHEKGHFGVPLRYLMKSLLSLGKECRFPGQNLHVSLFEAIQSTKCPQSEHLSQTKFLARLGLLVSYLTIPQPDDNRHQVNHKDFEYSVLQVFG
jgi:hypothetical protein